VTDKTTGLMWQKSTAPGTYTWQQALAYAQGLSLAGHTDWRLPNRNELQSLVDYSRDVPSIDPLLAPNTVSCNYWSSTTSIDYTNFAWYVSFGKGQVSYASKLYSDCVRAVRGGEDWLLGTVIISSNVTAPWTLTGPNSFSQTGTGNLTLPNLAPGNYILTWGDANGWTKPSPATANQTLSVFGTITFTGIYEQDIKLSNGVALDKTMTAATRQGTWKYYYVDLPNGSKNLIVDLYNLSDDLDLYVRQGTKPNTGAYDCRPYTEGLDSERCQFTSPSSGRWWIGVNNWDTGTISYTVKAKWSGGVGLPWQLLLLGN
jgi:hypothetical protein